MSIAELLQEIHSLMQEDTQAAMRHTGLVDLNEGEPAEASHGLYAGVPHSVSKWSDEANYLGLHAVQLQRKGAASPEEQWQAHHEAEQAHTFAARKAKDFPHLVELHGKGASFHAVQKAGLTKKHGRALGEVKEPEEREPEEDSEEEPMPKPPKKPDSSAAFPKGESKTEAKGQKPAPEDEHLKGYEAAARLAAEYSDKTQQPSATYDTQKLAASKHFIAAGHALVIGRGDLHKQHMERFQYHRGEMAKLKGPEAA